MYALKKAKTKNYIQTEGRQWADRITWRRERLREIRLCVHTKMSKLKKRRRIAEKNSSHNLGWLRTCSQLGNALTVLWRSEQQGLIDWILFVFPRVLSVSRVGYFYWAALRVETNVSKSLLWNSKRAQTEMETMSDSFLKHVVVFIFPMCSKRGRLCVMVGTRENDGISGKMLHDFPWLHDAKSLASILVDRSIEALSGLSPQSWL